MFLQGDISSPSAVGQIASFLDPNRLLNAKMLGDLLDSQEGKRYVSHILRNLLDNLVSFLDQNQII